VLFEAEGGPAQVVLIGTGSEVQLAVGRREQCSRRHPHPRGVDAVCGVVRRAGPGVPRQRAAAVVKARVAVEAGIGLTWHRFVGDAGRIVSLEHFGASADAKVLFREFGFTPEAVASAARESLDAVDR